MSRLVRSYGLDRTLTFAVQGYEFISRRCDRYRTDVLPTRLLLRPAICLRGPDAARLFYDPARFDRHNAFPARTQKTLTGVGGVQGMDGHAHRHRKELFLSLMSPASVAALADQFADRWHRRVSDWQRAHRVVLYDEVGRILCHAVHTWAGVPIADEQVNGRTNDLHAMIDAPAAVGRRYRRGVVARRRAERGLTALIDRVRAGTVSAADGTALRAIAAHRDLDGRPLDSRVAAVELLNVLRPTVAVDRFITFAALALHEHPQWRTRLDDGDAGDLTNFVQEVRRFYPFFPVVAARVHTPFDWRDIHFPTGRRTLLDLYGTNHHPTVWPDPETFNPDRFRNGAVDPYSLIPQGGGDHHHHRCPGEWITIAVMKTAVQLLTRNVDYQVPPQDLRISHRRMPTLPASGFVITAVTPVT